MFDSSEFVIIASASTIVDGVGLCGSMANFVAAPCTPSYAFDHSRKIHVSLTATSITAASATVGLCYSECHPPDGRSILNPAMKFKRNDGNPNASSYFWLRKLFKRPKISTPFGNR